MSKVDFRNSDFGNRLGAGGRAAIMAAGFKRHENGRAAGVLARVTQRHHFGMRVSRALRPPLPDDNPVLHNHRTHRRVRPTNPYRQEGFIKS